MDNKRFTNEMSGDFCGKTFLEIFETDPKNVEFARDRWIEDKCSGIFLDFYRYIQLNLSVPLFIQQHEERCRSFVINLDDVENTPAYMTKYLIKDDGYRDDEL